LVILKDPVDFGLISLVLLFGWFIWPVSDIGRVGDIAVLISGLAFVGLIFPLFRRNRYSFFILWGIFSGILFGLATFVRQPSGYALMVTSFMAIIFAGLKQRKIVLALPASAVLLVGSSLIPATLNGLFLYRDMKLQISAPNISPKGHGSGFSLIGGVGGRWFDNPSSYEYKNSLDIAFSDAVIWINLYNENPMAGFTQNSMEILQKTGERLFARYVSKHPVEFILISLQKAYSTLVVMFSIPIKWLSMVYFLIPALVIRLIVFRKARFYSNSAKNRILEMIAVFFILMIVAALPAILTTPYYGQSAYPAAAVMFFTGTLATYFIVKALFLKSMGDRNARLD